jgi:hypothetical protein
MRKSLSRRTKQKIAQWYEDRDARRHAEELEKQIERRKKCRLRLWECPGCGQKIRAATDQLDGFCGRHFPESLPYELKSVVIRTEEDHA